MFVFKRNQIIITVLVFMIAIAAYLNIKEPSSIIIPEVADSTQDAMIDMSDDDFFAKFEEENSINTLPPDDVVETPAVAVATAQALVEKQTEAQTQAQPEQQTKPEEGIQAVITKKVVEGLDDATIPASKTLEASYFVEEKILREQSRAAQVEQLTQYVANEGLDKESKAKAAEGLLMIQQRIEKESSAESLLRAKGFKDVFVRMDDETVDVVINKPELSDEEVAQIEEIVHRKTGYSIGKIRITPLNGITTNAESTAIDATKNNTNN